MKKTKIILIILCIILVGVLLATSIFLIRNHNEADDNNKIIVKDNVNIITTKDELQPLDVTDDSIIFNYDPGYEVGDIVVAGIIDAAPNGFIRRITAVSIEGDDYCYATEYAVLTDVFEEAHIIKTFAVTDEEVRDVEEIDNNVMSLNLSSTADDAIVQSLVYAENKNANVMQTSDTKIKPSENGLGVIVELSENVGENLEVSGKVEVNTYFELKIDIEDGEIEFGMAIHTDTSGELFVGIQEELFDKDDKDNFNGEYEKEIISKALPNIQFAIGPVPVVITNDFELSAEISAQLEGQIGTTVGVDAQRVSGFEYSSRTNEVKEINEKDYLSDGIDWKTEAKASGELEAGIYAHLVTKLYGSSGTDLAVGIAGDLSGELAAGIDDKLEPIVYGKLSLSIGPKASGKIVVTVPVIDYELLETEILKVTLPAFWEKEWETPDPMLIAMKNGDFSCFAGTYIATSEDNNNYGGGEKLNPLEMKKDGSLSGGGSWYMEDFYLKTKPISVEKKEDGTYLCTLDENSYYTIYPIGIIEDNEYVMENQSYLKDVVYIKCFVFDGGVLDVTYYYDSIDNTSGDSKYKIYTTNRAKKHMLTCPEFTFEYSDNWKISKEELETDYEWDVLTNERGVEFNYYQLNGGFGSQYYGGGYTMRYAKVSKIAESSFTPGYVQAVDYSSLGKFVVVKLEEYAQEDGLNGGGKYDVDGITIYAIVPETYLGEISFKGLGYWSCLSWEYPSPIAVLVTSPDGTFTKQEEQEIVHMLSTFKLN